MLALILLPSAVAIIASLLAITRKNPVHALLYLIVSLLAVAAVFYVIGAPFVAALEVIINAGAIMVLFLFAIMMLHGGASTGAAEGNWRSPRAWIGPAALVAVLFGELLVVVSGVGAETPPTRLVPSKEVSMALFGPYLLAVELASFLLLAGIVGAFHIGRRGRPEEQGEEQEQERKAEA
jgi:NADH-quinone oxidoreductase subunit J